MKSRHALSIATPVFGSMFLLSTQQAEACGFCLFEAAEETFPAAFAWSILATLWFIGVAGFFPGDRRLKDSPWRRGIETAVVAAMGVVLSVVKFGPFPAILLGGLALLMTIMHLLHRPTGWSIERRRAFSVYTAVTALLFGVTALIG